MNADSHVDGHADGHVDSHEIDEYVEALDSPVREIVIRLREIVTASSAEFQEGIKWNVPCYSINSNICSIIAHKNHVNLQVFRGAHIDDVDLLSGTGKDMRHVKLSKIDDIDSEQLKRILAQAIELDGS